MSDDMSPAELGRLIGRIESSIAKGFAEIKADLDKYVLKSVHEAEMKRVTDRFADLEGDIETVERRRREAEESATSRQRWIVGLLASIGLGLLGLALSFWSTFGPPQL